MVYCNEIGSYLPTLLVLCNYKCWSLIVELAPFNGFILLLPPSIMYSGHHKTNNYYETLLAPYQARQWNQLDWPFSFGWKKD